MNKTLFCSPKNHSAQFSYSKKSFGFTLIELVVVIIILAILAIVASSKFIDFRKDSIVATMDGMESAMQSAATLTYSKASIAGVEKLATSTLSINNIDVELAYGYPDGTAAGIDLLMDFPEGDWNKRPSIFDGAWIYWHGVITEDAGQAACYLRYRQATSASARPIINVVTNGC
ncbi:prepilin-type N-terminal cleavage/methylation domain-containing protein [Shewanella sp. 1_MG-2023]|uniref:prepilin-type N-terminal cleavage/methylation domain-containing protein n=1 Tax=unclassified Shewanella TaxID=196818 RepID=UPI0026E29677|nr:MULTISPECIES: prepilin-type N-terminal cleavage/methylation domain-containing protein [unclassified Shewanella]MDO6609870.1 prepilin-type N-terminal cleavage/methylation domain-containing protein [Shewanella sp. 7_MG-2023]MDO6769988.1 prepilin-type N-terminal cleavage/methylation domain-containing protein [Shewanella sp. 2_MG-2023]MDO6793052.1 prepilin-type N-terminal cleavage/methylation domain-containing protein [Shewanella sp. 1_MG-2023]